VNFSEWEAEVEHTQQTGQRIPLCRAADVPDGAGTRIDRGTTGTTDDVAVFHDGGRFYALNDTCTHAQASLSEGWVEDGEVECPMHSGRFDLETGEAVGMPAVRDTVAYRVEVRDGTVYLLADAGTGP
jgi:3-phenylpropionate/trans-cinnamate dioxygenase ferredoxin component